MNESSQLNEPSSLITFLMIANCTVLLAPLRVFVVEVVFPTPPCCAGPHGPLSIRLSLIAYRRPFCRPKISRTAWERQWKE